MLLECGLCDAVLSRTDHLREHREGQHYGIRFECHICQIQFTYRYSLRAHLSKVHGYHDGILDSCRVVNASVATHPIPEEIESSPSEQQTNEIKVLARSSSDEPIDDSEADKSLLVPLIVNNKRRKLTFSLPVETSPSMDRWSSMGTRIRWNDGNYLTLIKAMSANLMLLNMDTPAIDREMAWHRVYKSLERSGMPSCSMKAVKSIWHRLRLKARENIERYRKQKRNKVKNISQLSPTDQAIQELLDKYKFVAKKIRMENKIKKSNAALKSSPSTRAISSPKSSNGQKKESPLKNTKLRPRALSMFVPSKPVQTDEFDNMIEKYTHFEKLQLRVNTPQVCLEPMLKLNGNSAHSASSESPESVASSSEVISTPQPSQPPPSQPTLASHTSSNVNQSPPKRLRELQEEAANQDLLYKKAMLEHAEERMEFERQIHKKKLTMMNLEIEKLSLEIDLMQGAD